MRLPAAALVLLAVADLHAQADFNVTLMKRLDEHPAYNDIWGFVAPDGREFGIIGCKNGTSFIDATDPLAAHEVGFVGGPNCLWRDIKSWEHYVYIVNDCSSGVTVVDMADPSQPVVVNEFGLSFLQHIHTIQVDQQTGKLYCCGSAQGLVIYDLAVDPVNPPFVTKWKGQGMPQAVNGYVHALYVKDGMAHAGLIYDGLYVILDVSALPTITVVSSMLSGQEFTHSTWTSEDGKVSVVADEKFGMRNLQMYDSSNLADPVPIANLSQGLGTVPHNPYIRGDRLHASYYERGYMVWDVSDPHAPVKVGQYDTAPGVGATQLVDGAWGCYPFAPSGFVYVSDINNGFFLLKVNPACAPDPSGRPSLCAIWPGKAPTTGQTAPQMLLSGAGMLSVTALHVGDLTLGAGAFTALDDQVLAFPLPAVSLTGMLAVTAENAFGVSDPVYLPLQQPGGPQLASGDTHVPAGGSIEHTLSSSAGDLQYLAVSLLPTPSNAAKVHFAIGGAFSNLLLFAPIPAGPNGVSTLPPLPIPATAAGLTVYWQFAALAATPTWPAPVSNVTISVFDP